MNPTEEARPQPNLGLRSEWFSREERAELYHMLKAGDLVEMDRNAYR